MRTFILCLLTLTVGIAGGLIYSDRIKPSYTLSDSEQLSFLKYQMAYILTTEPTLQKTRQEAANTITNKLLADHRCPECSITFNTETMRTFITIPTPAGQSKVKVEASIPAPASIPAKK